MRDNKIRTTDELMRWVRQMQKQALKSRKAEENRRKQSARNKLNHAVRLGLVTKASQCALCSSTDRLQGHHADYEQPLAVTWLCVPCHNRIHDTITSVACY